MAVTETTDNIAVDGKKVKKFTTNLAAGGGQDTTTWVCPGGITSIRYLVVAGGGGGGGTGSGSGGGGGGAGGLLTGTIAVVPGQIYTIKVGAGGLVNANGSNSSIIGTGVNIVSVGGGRGSWSKKPEYYAGGNGGSGGGAADDPGLCTCGYGTAGQGHNGGGPPPATYGTGGGGGAGAAAATAVNYYGGNGGIGLRSDITGTNIYYAGGGAGSGSVPNSSYYKGGLGGGGNASAKGDGSPGTNGLGGGGGGKYGTTSVGGSGGSGVVILQYDRGGLVRTRQFNVTGSGNLLVMEVQT